MDMASKRDTEITQEEDIRLHILNSKVTVLMQGIMLGIIPEDMEVMEATVHSSRITDDLKDDNKRKNLSFILE